MKSSLLLFFFSLCFSLSFAQNVGIGTTNPNAKAILDVKATDKGILFPRLTSAQRDAIADPPNGLHIFNTDQRCLNYFDSLFQVWNCYCVDDTCKMITITASSGCGIDVFNTYASNYSTAKKLVILIPQGVVLNSCGPGSFALSFASFPQIISIKVINNGSILGGGGPGGTGATGQAGSCIRAAGSGGAGGPAILTKLGVSLTIENYGLIAGGGGGGGGGGSPGAGQYGGGGGGGAGTDVGTGGIGGGTTLSGPFGSCGTLTSVAQNGINGTATSSGGGGIGASGGGNGGAGGLRAQLGQTGTGTTPGAGGLAGKAVSGGSGNIVNNHGAGQVLGVVD